MDQFKSLFRKGHDQEQLKEIADKAIVEQSARLQANPSQEYRESIEDQEFNVLAQKNFLEDILGHEVINLELNVEESEKIQKYLAKKLKDDEGRVVAIFEYLAEFAGTLSPDEYKEKKEKLTEIEGKIRELNHSIAKQFSHAERYNSQNAFLYGQEIATIDSRLRQLEIDKQILEHELEMGSSKIPDEEIEELTKESDELGKKNMLNSRPHLN